MLTKKPVWVSHGAIGRFADGEFADFEKAKAWFGCYHLTGVHFAYPLDEGCRGWVRSPMIALALRQRNARAKSRRSRLHRLVLHRPAGALSL